MTIITFPFFTYCFTILTVSYTKNMIKLGLNKINKLKRGVKIMNKRQRGKIRISIDQKIHFGKPCISGTRIPVENVLELVEEGIPFSEIITKYYPDLDIEDIKACVRYATELVKSEEIHVESG